MDAITSHGAQSHLHIGSQEQDVPPSEEAPVHLEQQPSDITDSLQCVQTPTCLRVDEAEPNQATGDQGLNTSENADNENMTSSSSVQDQSSDMNETTVKTHFDLHGTRQVLHSNDYHSFTGPTAIPIFNHFQTFYL